MFPLRQNASKTPKWVRSGAVAGDGQHCSRHDVDPGRGSGSLREASVGSSSVPLVCSLPFGAPMPRRHGSSNYDLKVPSLDRWKRIAAFSTRIH